MPNQTTRQPPHDLTAERAVLGSILIERDAIITIAPWFRADYFSLQKHIWIYEAMLACYQRVPSVPPDLSTVADELRRRDQLELVGGIGYLGELSAEVPTALHIEYYARIVERTGVLRSLIAVGSAISALGYDERADLSDTLGAAESRLFAVTQAGIARDYTGSADCASEMLQWLQEVEARGGQAGIATGFYDLDRITGGFQSSDLIILAAHTSMGKTTLAQNIALNVAQHGGVVGIVSLEMSRVQIVQRFVSMLSGVPLRNIRGTMDDDERTRVMDGMGVFSGLPIWIDDEPGQRITAMRSKSRSLAAQHGCDLLIVDYLQIAEPSTNRKEGNRNLDVADISRNLKAMAREINVPVLALSQLRRATGTRGLVMPQLDDLRDSGAVEQDADMVLMLHREELRDKDTEKKGMAEVAVAKHRNGALGSLVLRFDGPVCRFQNMERGRAVEGY